MRKGDERESEVVVATKGSPCQKGPRGYLQGLRVMRWERRRPRGSEYQCDSFRMNG